MGLYIFVSFSRWFFIHSFTFLRYTQSEREERCLGLAKLCNSRFPLISEYTAPVPKSCFLEAPVQFFQLLFYLNPYAVYFIWDTVTVIWSECGSRIYFNIFLSIMNFFNEPEWSEATLITVQITWTLPTLYY